jgi:hypothetical protein
MREPTQVVKGGPHGRPAGTEAKRRPLTTGHTTTATMDNAPPTGRGPQAHDAARSAAHKNQFTLGACSVSETESDVSRGGGST